MKIKQIPLFSLVIAACLVLFLFKEGQDDSNNAFVNDKKEMLLTPSNDVSLKKSETESADPNLGLTVSKKKSGVNPLPEKEKSEHINSIYSEVENGNFEQISALHEMAIKCFSTKGYNSIESYIADIGIHSALDRNIAIQIFNNCENSQITNLESLDSIYTKALREGSKEAEFLLGVLYPPSFERSIGWLTRAATWKPEAQSILFDTIEQSSSTSNQLKLFWLNVQKSVQPEIFENAKLIKYESTMEESERLKIEELATLWSKTKGEKEKRSIATEVLAL